MAKKDKYMKRFDNNLEEEKNNNTGELKEFQDELDNYNKVNKPQVDGDKALINMLSNKGDSEVNKEDNKQELIEKGFKDIKKSVDLSLNENNPDELVSKDPITKPSQIKKSSQQIKDPIDLLPDSKTSFSNQKDDFDELKTKTEEDNDTLVQMDEVNNNKTTHNNTYKVSNDVLKIIMLVLSGFVLVLSVWIMFKSFSPQQEYSTPILSYNVNNGIKYKIYLTDNDFYETAYLGMNELVPTPFIKYIEIDFSSALQSQKKLDYNYTYKVTGEINAYYTGGEEEKKGTIWSKKYTFVNPISKSEENASSINLNQKVRIDYNTYNNLVNKYKLKASIPMEAFLTVNFTANVNSDIKDSNKNLNENIVSSVKIPLSVATVQLTTEDNTSGSKVLSNTEKIEASRNYVLLIFSFILFIGSAAITIKLLIDLKKMTENHSVLFKLNKILKDHDQVVVEIDQVPKVKNATVIEIKQFKDMIDIQQELHIPILYYKSEEITENSFYIIHNNQIYKYIINSEMEQI